MTTVLTRAIQTIQYEILHVGGGVISATANPGTSLVRWFDPDSLQLQLWNPRSQHRMSWEEIGDALVIILDWMERHRWWGAVSFIVVEGTEQLGRGELDHD